MKPIMLGQLIQYFDKFDERVNRIQITMGNREWKDADEVSVDSELLKPWKHNYIQFMGMEKSYKDGENIIRVSLLN